MAKIYLVRHAESIANTEGRYQGHTYDTDLSILGQQQARALADHLIAYRITKVIVSPLRRTYQTGLIIAKRKGIPIIAELRLIETNHGTWEGQTKKEITRNWPTLYKMWTLHPSVVQFPEGEKFLETQNSVINWWIEIKDTSENLLVVTHDNIVRIIIAYIFGLHLDNMWRFHLDPTAVTLIERNKNGDRLLCLNDNRHLGGLDSNLATHAL